MRKASVSETISWARLALAWSEAASKSSSEKRPAVHGVKIVVVMQCRGDRARLRVPTRHSSEEGAWEEDT